MSGTISFYYQKKHGFETRKNLSAKISEKYPDRIPVIVEIHHLTNINVKLNHERFLIPASSTIMNFTQNLLKMLGTDNPHGTTFLFTEYNTIPLPQETFLELSEKYKNKDGFIYLKLCMEENAFGGLTKILFQ